jgi:hypothetical protein
MAQLNYTRSNAAPFAGQIDHAFGPYHIDSLVNDAGAEMSAGVFVGLKNATLKTVTSLAAEATKVAGVILNNFGRNPDDLAGSTAAYDDGAVMPVLARGRCWVRTVGVVADDAAAVYVVHTGADAGKLTATDDGATRAIKVRVLKASTASNLLALVEFDVLSDR